MTVAVFTFVLLLVNGLKEILPLLIDGRVSLLLVLKGIGLLIPWILLYSLPMGMLTATLLVFGRFSADQELTASRASGISLVALVTPVLLLSVVFSGICAWVNMEIAPRCRVAYKNLLYSVAKSNPAGLLRENQYQDFPGGWTIYVRKIRGNDLEGVKIYQSKEDGDSLAWYNARAGNFSVTDDGIVLTLLDVSASQLQNGTIQDAFAGEYPIEIPTKANKGNAPKTDLTDMTFAQLRAQLKKVEHSLRRSRASTNALPEELREELGKLRKFREDVTMPILVQIHREVAFSFACIGFTLIGIPLGIRAHRRETSIGMAIALVLVLVYYSFIILAQSWDTKPQYAPYLIVWIPNFIFQAVGAVLLWRANKGAS
jgi:lipopolysaccharide export system permease protein